LSIVLVIKNSLFLLLAITLGLFGSTNDSSAHTFTTGNPRDGPSDEFNSCLLMMGNSF